jgi:hypothetical protein
MESLRRMCEAGTFGKRVGLPISLLEGTTVLHHAGERRISRRTALQLGLGAGAAALASPYVARAARLGGAVDLGDAELALSPNPGWPVPAIVTRAQWGANEGLRRGGQIYDSSIQKIIVHHTGTPNDITNYAGLCRSILSYETSGEYIDIAYNWLIDPDGRIYEGRWATDYPGGAAHTGERSGANVRGGHALNHNTRTIGIALMGTYDDIDPSGPMIDALVTLLTWKCARWGLDPRGRGNYTAGNGAVENLFNICGHRDTYATDCPGTRVEPMLPSIRDRVAGRLSGGGYWIAGSNGQVYAFGTAPLIGNAGATTSAFAAHPTANGYWTATPNGTVKAFGAAKSWGDRNGRPLNAPIIGMACTPTGNGYWLVGADGGIFTYGDARFYGSTGGKRLNQPVLGMMPTATGKGYWLYARDGGIFTFGDAKFMGSTGSIYLASPITSMARRPQGDGYWLVAQDGGVWPFGAAPYVGSDERSGSRSPCVAMLPTPTGRGYVLLRRNGSVRAFGDAPYLGSAFGATAIGIGGHLKAL